MRLAHTQPSPSSPCSSPLQSMNRIVRLGFTPAFMSILAASSVVAQPVPLSVAPVAPSHESMCPPTITYSSGFSVPGMSAITLYSLIGPFLK